MASIEHRPERARPWRVRWRDANGRMLSRSFTTRRDADRYRHEVEHQLDRGHYPDPGSGRVAFADLAGEWLDGKRAAGRKPSTVVGYAGLLDSVILPRLGGHAVGAIRYDTVAGFAASIGHLSTSRRRAAVGVVAQVMDLAIRRGHVAANPARLVDLPPSAPRRRHRYLSHQAVHRLYAQAGDDPLVLLLAYTGLRWGEAVALRGSDVDRVRGLVHVDRSQTEAGGPVQYVAPKNHQRRDVPIPDLVLEVLPDAGGELLFPAPLGGPLRLRNYRSRVWVPATRAAGCEGLRVHELRHTAASLARQAGADAFVVARMLGHADASITARVYSDLFDVELHLVRRMMDEAARKALGAPAGDTGQGRRGTLRDAAG